MRPARSCRTGPQRPYTHTPPNMAWCPHCNHFYDEDNESQPCCGACGHPISCGCHGHSDAPPARHDRSWRSSLRPDDGAFDADDDLPF